MPLIRDPGLRAASIRRSSRCSTACRRTWRRRSATAKAVKGRYVRDRAAGPAADADAGRGRGLSATAGTSPARARPRRRTPPTAATPAGPSTATRAAATATAARRTPQENTDDPWWEVDLGARVPDRVDRRSTTAPTATSASGSNDFTLKVLDARPQRRLREDEAAGPEGEGRRSRSAAASPERRRPPRGDARADHRPRPGGRDVQGPGEVRQATTPTAPPRSRRSCASRRATGRRTRPSRCSTACSPYIRDVPVAERTTPAALDALQLGDAWPRCCPPTEAKAVRKELGELGVRVIRVGTVLRPDALRQGTARRAGRQAGRVRLREHRPHAAQLRRRRSPGRWRRSALLGRGDGHRSPVPPSGNYVPDSPSKILLASRLLQPRESQKLELHRARASRASIPTSAPTPATGGGCTGRCTSSRTSTTTSPNPEAYLAKNPLPIKDELLKFNRPRTEWKLEELAAAVERDGGQGGRSFANGKQMFKVATCVACHKFGGAGQRVRPRPDEARPQGSRTPSTS